MPWGVAAAAVIGGVATYASSSNAAGAQSAAGRAAINEQQQQFAATRSDLSNWVNIGDAAMTNLGNLTGSPHGGTQDPLHSYLTEPVTMDQATLEATPGYQFNLAQGLKATQNSAAARGLGVSGAALKGAATYATGLADSTYQNQFNNEVTNRTNTYNRLSGLATLGENAAAMTGSIGAQTAANIGNNLVGIGNANAAAANATGGAISSGANSAGQAYMLNKLLAGNGGGGSSGIYNSSNTFGDGNYGADLYNPGADSGVTSPY